MRTTKMGTLLVLGVVAALLVGCGDADTSIGTSTDTAARGAVTTLAPDPPNLTDELVALGVDLDAAPSEAIGATGAAFCGTADLRGAMASPATTPDPTTGAARECFVDHARAGTDADLIESHTTVEGDPIVIVWRTSSGTTTVFTDSTRDAFGSGTWHDQACPSVALAFDTSLTCL